MKTGERILGPASCRIRQSDAIPAKMRGRVRELTALIVKAEERTKGYGTSLVHKVCREADKANMVLMVFPEPFDYSPFTQAQLIEWYSSNFGFSVTQTHPVVLMMRAPGSTPRLLELKPIVESIQIAKQGMK